GDHEVVHVWDINYFQSIQTIMDWNCRWGQITCLKFISPNIVLDWICFGTGRGLFLVYCHLRKSVSGLSVFPPGNSVEGFYFDPVHYCLIVTSHFGQIKMYEVNAGMLVDLWIEETNDAIPCAVLFVDKGNSVIVYGLETGTAWVLIFTRDAKV
ncbi:hypothetical protein BYT27DRAFT_7095207, partial [Phlegmacium glaucopus]